MRILLGGAAAAALALGSMSVALAAPCTMSGMMMGHFMPHCTPASGPVVWLVTTAKLYYLKGSPQYGKGKGVYVCRATAVARGAHPGRAAMGGSHGSPMSMPVTKTMVPRPMSSPPGSAMPSGAPGSMGSPRPVSSGNPMSGNQGNTGAPGAGGQVPNNPASSSNNNPSPSPSPHP